MGNDALQKFKDYVDRVFKGKNKSRSCSLSVEDAITFINEMQREDENGLFYAILILFDYGCAKGYHACKAEQKKGGAA